LDFFFDFFPSPLNERAPPKNADLVMIVASKYLSAVEDRMV
jgi:hypothetical protein